MWPDFTEPDGARTCFKYPFFVCLVVFCLRNFHAERNLMLVVMRNNEVTAIPMEESAGKLKYVSPDDSIVKYAKRLGISFGDE